MEFSDEFTSPDYTVVTFSRLLDTGDTTGDIAITNQPLYLLWAVSSIDPLASGAYAQHDAAATAGPVDLLSIPSGPIGSASTEHKRKTHGVIMLVAWVFFAVYGVFVARYMKALGGVWMYASSQPST